LTGLIGSIFILIKIQNGIVLEKKSTSCNRVFDKVLPGQPGRRSTRRVGRVTPGHDFSIFSSTRSGSSPESIGSRVDPPGRAWFQNYVQTSPLELATSIQICPSVFFPSVFI
jgi:hypothetical protein